MSAKLNLNQCLKWQFMIGFDTIGINKKDVALL